MQRDDLPLFTWKPACRVIAFPASARVGKIRATAKTLSESRTAREATFRWHRAADAMEGSLFKAGLSGIALRQEMEAFMMAVDVHLIGLRSEWRLTGRYDTQDTGGAA